MTALQYAETPISDIDGSSFQVFEPTPLTPDGYPEFGSTTITNVIEAFASDEVNGQEVPPPSSGGAISVVGSFFSTGSSATFTVRVLDSPELAPIKALEPSGKAQVTFTYGANPDKFDQLCTVASFFVAGDNCTFTFTAPVAWTVGTSGSLINFTIKPATTGALSVVGPFTLPVRCDRIRWNTVFLRGLQGAVQIRATWWKVDAAGTMIGGTAQDQTFTYSADTLDQRFFTTDVTPIAGPGQYRIQFERLTPELGGQGADVAKLENVFAVRYYASKQLPGVTVVRVTTAATNGATGFRDRKFNVRWLRHVRQLASDRLGESRNFARAMAHIWTIAGNDIAGLDTAALAAINAEFGENSPLLRFDQSLDDADQSLGERLQLVANMARCVVWRDGLKWTVTRDQARAFPELQLDYRNLAAGADSTISYAAHLPASNDGVEVEYVDEVTQAKKAYIRLSVASGVPVEGLSRNPKKIKMPGCTTLSQAANRAAMEARRLLYQRVSVADTVLADGALLGLGSLVRWVDPNDFAGDDGIQAGEVMAIAGNVISTSEPLDWKGQTSGRIVFTGADGRQLGAPVVCYPVPGGARLDRITSGIYVADGDRQLGSRYAFSVGLSAAELQAAGLYTVTEIRPAADGTFSLGLSAYDARIYEADA